jgi:hypothetical protein
MRAPAEVGGLVGPHLQAFFAEHLLAHKRASPETVACYRDTFRLLLRFMRQRTGADAVGHACSLSPRRQAPGLSRDALIMPGRP